MIASFLALLTLAAVVGAIWIAWWLIADLLTPRPGPAN